MPQRPSRSPVSPPPAGPRTLRTILARWRGQRHAEQDAAEALGGGDLDPELRRRYQSDFDDLRGAWLRRRAAWYYGTLTAVIATWAVLVTASIVTSELPSTVGAIELVGSLLAATACTSVLTWLASFRPDRRLLLRVVTWLMIAMGILDIVLTMGIAHLLDGDAASTSLPVQLNAFTPLVMLTASHFGASLFLPWTPREAMRPVAPLAITYGLAALFIAPAPAEWRLAAAIGAPLFGLPGIVLCWYRHRSFRRSYLMDRLQQEIRHTRDELLSARGLHDTLLPPTSIDGPVRLRYAFAPVQHLGGDFVFARVHDDTDPVASGAVTSIVVDVTGHGLPAALAVHRVHGELERLFGETPDLSPGDAMVALHRYFHHTIIRHHMYATAFALRVEPDGTVRWANAGHLPGYLVRRHGRVERLAATATMLGVLPPDQYDAAEQRTHLDDGDRLVVVTDGITEAADASGAMLGVDGTEELVRRLARRRGPAAMVARASANGGIARGVPAPVQSVLDRATPPRPLVRRLLRAVARYAAGGADDDRLVVEVARNGAFDGSHDDARSRDAEPVAAS